MAFKKLDGVSDIKILAGDKPGTQKVMFASTNAGITKEMAMKSLGKKAAKYVVVKLMKGAAASS